MNELANLVARFLAWLDRRQERELAIAREHRQAQEEIRRAAEAIERWGDDDEQDEADRRRVHIAVRARNWERMYR